MSAQLTERSDVKLSARIYPEEARPGVDEGSHRDEILRFANLKAQLTQNDGKGVWL